MPSTWTIPNASSRSDDQVLFYDTNFFDCVKYKTLPADRWGLILFSQRVILWKLICTLCMYVRSTIQVLVHLSLLLSLFAQLPLLINFIESPKTLSPFSYNSVESVCRWKWKAIQALQPYSHIYIVPDHLVCTRIQVITCIRYKSYQKVRGIPLSIMIPTTSQVRSKLVVWYHVDVQFSVASFSHCSSRHVPGFSHWGWLLGMEYQFFTKLSWLRWEYEVLETFLVRHSPWGQNQVGWRRQ